MQCSYDNYAGVLSRVNNLHASYEDNFSLGVSWDPPYSLQGVPILGYSVTVTVADSGEEVYNDTSNDARVRVPGATLRACHDYIVTVVANNEVGSGNSSSINVDDYPGGKYTASNNHSLKMKLVSEHCRLFVQNLIINQSCAHLYLQLLWRGGDTIM